MNGTSASAPFVTGLVALVMQYRASKGDDPLTADQIRTKLKRWATRDSLKPNRHNSFDDTQIVKQKDVFDDVIGDGKIGVSNTVKSA